VFIVEVFKGRSNRKEYCIRRIEGGGENLQATLPKDEGFSLEDSMNLFKDATDCSTVKEVVKS
jgi:hypothetical protein